MTAGCSVVIGHRSNVDRSTLGGMIQPRGCLFRVIVAYLMLSDMTTFVGWMSLFDPMTGSAVLTQCYFIGTVDFGF